MSRTAAARTAALGALEVMRAEPDGYTIGAISELADDRSIRGCTSKLQYRPLRDFIAVARVNHFPSLSGRASRRCRIKTVAELIAYAKEKPGTLNYSSGGVGNFSHLGLAMLAFQTGINIVHVPYRGVGPGHDRRCSPATCSSCTTTSRPRCRTSRPAS